MADYPEEIRNVLRSLRLMETGADARLAQLLRLERDLVNERGDGWDRDHDSAEFCRDLRAARARNGALLGEFGARARQIAAEANATTARDAKTERRVRKARRDYLESGSSLKPKE